MLTRSHMAMASFSGNGHHIVTENLLREGLAVSFAVYEL